MKRIFTFFFALLSACTFSAYAAIVDGTCGDNLTWTLNTKDSTLVISGTGEMTTSYMVPWYDYKIYIKYVTLPDGLTSIGNDAFRSCTSLTSVTIPNSVMRIGNYAFRSCSSLTSITIPNSVTSIGNYAFAYCSALTSITIPNSVTSIGRSAFEGCSGLTSVTIPNSVTSIGDGAFGSCDGLTSVTIGNSVTSIGERAFGSCGRLTSIVVEEGNTIYDSRENCNAIIETATNTLISGCQNTIIPNSVTSIGSYAFAYCSGLTSITIPNSVTSIGEEAFYSCKSLTSITIGNSVTSIGERAFGSCGLTSVTLGNSVTSIGNYAFAYCSALTSITIPNSVTSIEGGAFEGCYNLTSIVVEEGNTIYDSRENCNAIIETATNTLIRGCQNTIIPNSVTSIGSGAFAGCSSLTSITIPNSVTSIGDGAFAGCKGLTSPVYNAHCFAYMPSSYEGNYTIPDGIKQIAGGAFESCSKLTSITIPNSVTSIGDGAFALCSSLTSITIPNSVTSIGEMAFGSCGRLTSVTLGNSVTSIGENAFVKCYGIQEVTSYAATPPAAAVCGLNHTSCTLYVPAEYIDTYSNTYWWEDFKEIRAIDADYVVTFVDWDGTVLASVGVAAGQAATAPADPTREGYTFIGWDSDFSSVTEDMTVTALYQINRYQVSFYDWDDTLLKTDSVNYQSAATAPADPVREGYTFIGWDKDFSSITADLDVYAQYEAGADKEFEVIFSDQNNNELSAQSVTLRVPVAPQIEGFTFLYWQPVAAPLDDVITIQAVYESNTPTAAPEVFVNPSNPAQKLIRNGQVYILKDDKTYTIMGAQIQ